MSIPASNARDISSQTVSEGAGSGQRLARAASAAKARKLAEVEELSRRLRESQGVLLADYRGLKVREMGELRRRLREAQADMSVVKNTLLRLALARLGRDGQAERRLEIPEQMAEGPTAVIFCAKDVVAVAKALSAFAREHRLPVLKGGNIEGKAIEAAQALELATLPSRQELMAQLLGLVAQQAPGGLLISSLRAAIGRFVATLSAYSARIQAAPAGGAQASAQTAGVQ